MSTATHETRAEKAEAKAAAKHQAATEPIEIGDVVTLVSGGPAMTVQSVNAQTGDFGCFWFDTNHGFHEHVFKRALIVKKAE